MFFGITTINCIPTHVRKANVETDHTLFITDTANETTLTSQDYTIDLNMTEVVVTIRDVHPTLYPTITAAHNTHQLTDALRYTPIGISHGATDATCPWPDTLHTGAILTSTPLTIVSLAQGTCLILPIDTTDTQKTSKPHSWTPTP